MGRWHADKQNRTEAGLEMFQIARDTSNHKKAQILEIHSFSTAFLLITEA